MDELKISLVIKELPVKVAAKDGSEKNYVMRELTGIQRDTFLNWMSKRVSFEGGKAAMVQNFEGVQAELLAKCLYDENNHLVLVEVLQNEFPASALSKLFDAAQKLSSLSVEAVEEAKNA